MPSSSSSAAPDVLLQLRHVSKIYGELHAVDDVSLDVPRGQWLSLVGSSGSGKTTLMNIIGCMDTATKGSVLLDGRELQKYPTNPARAGRRRAHLHPPARPAARDAGKTAGRSGDTGI